MNNFSGNFNSKLPSVGTTIFSTMSALAIKHGAINLSQGFPDFDCHPKLIELVDKHMRDGSNQYAPMPGTPQLREAIAEKIYKMHSVTYNDKTEITVTAGATQAIQVAIASLISEDDEVIIIEPAYDAYAPLVTLNKGRAVFYKSDDSEELVNWAQLLKMVNSRTKMIIINTPHNPTSKILKEADLLKLERLIADTDIVVLSDEVYEHIIFDGREHQSVCRFENLRNRSIMISSFGKTYHTTGWKIGYICAPENLTKEIRKVFQYSQFSVITPMQLAFAEFLEDEEQYLGLSEFYQNKRDLFQDAIDASSFQILPSEGSYFQCVKYDGVSDLGDRKFVEEMTAKHGVAAIPVSSFYRNKEDDHIIRFCFAKSDETLKKAGDLLCKI